MRRLSGWPVGLGRTDAGMCHPTGMPPALTPDLMRSLGLDVDGPARWGSLPASQAPGIFAVETNTPFASAPLDQGEIRRWLERVPGLRIDDEPGGFLDGYQQEDFIPDYRTRAEEKSTTEFPFLGNLVEQNDFREALRQQLTMLSLSERALLLAHYLIDNLDDDGYLRISLEDVLDNLAFSQQLYATEDELLEQLETLQSLEPIGVGARDLRECLLLQIENKPSQISFDVANKHIILIDDVFYTGRTTRAAMNELFDYGRPASITLVSLVNRGGRELPIAPQIVAANMSLAAHQNLQLLQNTDGTLTLQLENTSKDAEQTGHSHA